MATKYLRNGKTFQVVDSLALNEHDKLPPGNYLIKATPEGILYLEDTEPFVAPPKLYGTTVKTAYRILSTFADRPSGTGVLLSGEKGSGKTLLCRTTCIEAAKAGIPTIIINQPWKGDQFFSFVSSITQPCIFVFDEFEKVYIENDGNRTSPAKHDQNAILTLLDGVFQTKKLFLLTSNDSFGINRNLLNRPGRIFYAIEFTGLDENFVREYLADNLDDKTQIDSFVKATRLFSQFNFDMLKATVEEMNRYKEPVEEALKLLNVSPMRDYSTYQVKAELAGGEEITSIHTTEIENPLGLKDGINVYLYYRQMTQAIHPEAEPEDEYDPEPVTEGKVVGRSFRWMPTDLVEADASCLKFINKDGDKLYLSRRQMSSQWQWDQNMKKKAIATA